MRYEKPELVVLGSALTAVQSTGLKSGQFTDHDCGGSNDEHTSCAYEADE
jgi:hypothetical protein